MLALNDALCVGDVVSRITFVNVDMAQGYGLWWGDVSGVPHLFLAEV